MVRVFFTYFDFPRFMRAYAHQGPPGKSKNENKSGQSEKHARKCNLKKEIAEKGKRN